MFTCELVEKTSKKGNPYVALVITFPSGYKKTVFLESAEKELAILSKNMCE